MRLSVVKCALALFLGAWPAGAQEVLEDQDPVDLEWVPAWDAPFWPAPSGAALELALGRHGTAPGAAPENRQATSGEYLLALLTLPLGRARPPAPSPEGTGVADGPVDAEGPATPERSSATAPSAGPDRASASSSGRSESALAEQPVHTGGAQPEETMSQSELAPSTAVSLELLQDAIEKAERAAGFRSALRRLSSIGQRARWSGLAPELRLRGATGFDQTRSIDSAGIVPSDETLRDGSDSLVEVRLTFHLERLLHSGQEVALERARQQLLADRAEVRALVSQELVTYVRALGQVASESWDEKEREKLALAAERARVSLYLLTDGWFRGEETLRRYEGPRDAGSSSRRRIPAR